MSVLDGLVQGMEISTNKVVEKARQFEVVVIDTQLRAEVAELLADTIVALTEIGCRLDRHRSFQPTTITDPES